MTKAELLSAHARDSVGRASAPPDRSPPPAGRGRAEYTGRRPSSGETLARPRTCWREANEPTDLDSRGA